MGGRAVSAQDLQAMFIMVFYRAMADDGHAPA
jgi:hypothetical protein